MKKVNFRSFLGSTVFLIVTLGSLAYVFAQLDNFNRAVDAELCKQQPRVIASVEVK